MENPDALEKGIRFGCGFFFGLLVAFSNVLFFSVRNGYYYAAALLVASVVFGLLAVRYGDDLWEHLRKWWWWT